MAIRKPIKHLNAAANDTDVVLSEAKDLVGAVLPSRSFAAFRAAQDDVRVDLKRA